MDRIIAEDYEPSDQDILCARLRTTGVQEYHFSMDRSEYIMAYLIFGSLIALLPSDNGGILKWIMYDVSGEHFRSSDYLTDS